MSDSSITPSPRTESAWPGAVSAGLHSALCRRIPPALPAVELEPLTVELVAALEQGELTLPLTTERRRLAEASGWLMGDDSPLLIQGDRIGWRRWLQAMEEVVEGLVSRCALQPFDADPLPAPALPETLNAEQRAAVCALDHNSVVLLSGGPGTGKTSTVVELLRRAEARNPDLRIGWLLQPARPLVGWGMRCSPVGRHCPAAPCTAGWNPAPGGSGAMQIDLSISICW